MLIVRINLFDESAEQTTFEVSTAGSEERIAWMPVQTQRGRLDLLLDVLGHPEALLRLVVAYTNAALTATDGELLFVGRPFHTRRRSVNA